MLAPLSIAFGAICIKMPNLVSMFSHGLITNGFIEFLQTGSLGDLWESWGHVYVCDPAKKFWFMEAATAP